MVTLYADAMLLLAQSRLIESAYKGRREALDTKEIAFVVLMVFVAGLPGLIAIAWQLGGTLRVGDRAWRLWHRDRRLCIATLLVFCVATAIAIYYFKYWYNVGAAPRREPRLRPLGVLVTGAILAVPSLPAWGIGMFAGSRLLRLRSSSGYWKIWPLLLVGTLIWTSIAIVDLITWPSGRGAPGWGGPVFELVLVRAPIWYLVFAPGVALFATVLASYPQMPAESSETFTE